MAAVVRGRGEAMGPEPKKDERKLDRDPPKKDDPSSKDLPSALHDRDVATERATEPDKAVEAEPKR
jgi:hypothetical protein